MPCENNGYHHKDQRYSFIIIYNFKSYFLREQPFFKLIKFYQERTLKIIWFDCLKIQKWSLFQWERSYDTFDL